MYLKLLQTYYAPEVDSEEKHPVEESTTIEAPKITLRRFKAENLKAALNRCMLADAQLLRPMAFPASNHEGGFTFQYRNMPDPIDEQAVWPMTVTEIIATDLTGCILGNWLELGFRLFLMNADGRTIDSY